MTTHLETDRLILRDWKPEDQIPFARLNADAMIMEYFPRTLNEKASESLLKKFRKHLKQHGYGFYALELKKTGEFIGFAGLQKVVSEIPFAPAVELAWRLDYGAWGKGYATEAALALFSHGFDKLGLNEIVAYAVHDNNGAIRVMEKLAMKRDMDADFNYPGLAKDHPLGSFVLYRLKKTDFNARIA
ncbi:MAG: GNAT family N-acetyltransferase [Alphaproteobacteria bacterium]